nr:MAG TPA: hypothetical protein [Caudoviricetes sp.]
MYAIVSYTSGHTSSKSAGNGSSIFESLSIAMK